MLQHPTLKLIDQSSEGEKQNFCLLSEVIVFRSNLLTGMNI